MATYVVECVSDKEHGYGYLYALNDFSPDDFGQSAASFRLPKLQEHEDPPPNIPYLPRHGYCFFVKRSADA
jgi:hypothetical protein